MAEQEFLPTHVGIIMDGNGRWAKKRGLPRKMGHRAGAEVFKTIVRYANRRGLKYLTMYVFSTENWKRPEDEVASIMKLLRNYLAEVDQYRDENIRIRFLGDLSVFEPDIQARMEEIREESAHNTGLTLNLAVNYGGRNELVYAARRLAEKVKAGELEPEQITEQMVTENLYAGDEPDVDLIIRPSGEYRLSNFLIWQSAYAEYVFMDEILWPDFKPAHLDQALLEYQKRNRRFGGI
ncbi:MAG: isoprenyl transferase [Candidatus Merdivicinus sp.]|jgi:undecaprenyl diphosphate synthase